MRPLVTLPDGGDLGQITVLIVKRESKQVTAQFRHIVRRTHDPAERYAAGLRVLAEAYYQRSQEFADEITALFAQDSRLATALLAAGRCRLTFEQHGQRYEIHCAVRQLSHDDLLFQATYWHNSMFNPSIPGAIDILAFQPQWAEAVADPPVMSC